MKTLTAEEIKSKRATLLSDFQKLVGKIGTLDQKWQAKIIAASSRAVKKFKRTNEKKFAKSKARLEDKREKVNDSLNELKRCCPNKDNHTRPSGRYVLCPTCGYVWDDTSPAHP